MSTTLLLNDWHLTVVSTGEVLYDEPAAVLERGNALTFGGEALAQARLHPRQSNVDYLGKLSADPLAQPFDLARNHADLLYHHLKSLAEQISALREPTLVVVPSTVSNEQLSLLLGVAQEAGVRIGSFADLACICAAAQPKPQAIQFLELNMTSAYHCTVSLEPNTVAGAATEYLDTGISRIIDGWTNVIADQFVSSSRFDPLHAAHTEQQLYNLVTGWFGSATPSSYVTVEHNDETRRQEVGIDSLRARLEATLEPMLARLDPDQPVRLGPNAATVPLLRTMLETRYTVQTSNPEQLLDYLTARAPALLSGDDVHYHRALEPAQSTAAAELEAKPAAPASSPAPQTDVATHGLHATTAYRIGSPMLPESAVTEPQPGSTVSVDGRLFTLIRVED